MSEFSQGELVVIKHGSSVVENDDGIGLNQDKIDYHMMQHVRLRAEGLRTIEVASGAVVEGKEYVRELGGIFAGSLEDNELAMHGTSRQIQHWEEAARLVDIMVAQALFTHEELAKERDVIRTQPEMMHLARYILGSMHKESLVVANENSVTGSLEMEEYEENVAAKERGEDDFETDNDWLAARLALATRASGLLLLTNVDGVEVDGKVVSEIKVADIVEMWEHCEGVSRSGVGGMYSKLGAAAVAAGEGIKVTIGNAFTDLRRLLEGEAGTRVVQ